MSREILLGVDMHGDRAAVREAVSTSKGLASFWTSDSTAEPVAGSEAKFGFEGAPMGLRFSVDKIDDNGVDWTCVEGFPGWNETTVSWGFGDEPEHGGTRVLFRHAGFADDQPDWDVASVTSTWAKVLERLKVYVETGTAEPVLG
jgi:hypothetical protein